jgi:hypothetical protein
MATEPEQPMADCPPIDAQPIGGLAFMVIAGDEEGSRIEFIPTIEGREIRFIRMGGRVASRR